MFAIKFDSSAFVQSRTVIRRAVRAALEKTFVFWHRTFAPLHFKLIAFQRYYEAYSWNYKIRKRRDADASDESTSMSPVVYDPKSGKLTKLFIRRGGSKGESALPLVKTGTLRGKFLFGGYTFGRELNVLTITWTTLGPPSGFAKIVNAMTYVNREESDALAAFFDASVSSQLEREDGPSARTYGKAVL